jgi:hypothetical protein
MARLPPTDLDEYLNLVATLIKRTDIASSFPGYFSAECQAILDSAQDDVALPNRALQLKSGPIRDRTPRSRSSRAEMPPRNV